MGGAYHWSMLRICSPKWNYILGDIGGWILNGYFLHLAHFSYDKKHAISTRRLANPNQALAIFLVIIGVHMNM